jgi:hypothetical protein
MVRHPHTPQYGINAQYVLNLINPISQDGGKQGEVFASTGFYVPGSTQVHYLDDDSVGNIRLSISCSIPSARAHVVFNVRALRAASFLIPSTSVRDRFKI